MLGKALKILFHLERFKFLLQNSFSMHFIKWIHVVILGTLSDGPIRITKRSIYPYPPIYVSAAFVLEAVCTI